MDDRAIALEQQRLDELNGASLRALAADDDLHYRGSRAYRGEQRLRITSPHLMLAPESAQQAEAATRRALSDGIALRLLHSSASLHQSLAPGRAIERLLFDLLEQLRVESLVPEWMPGQRENLRQRFSRWTHQFQHSGQCENVAGLLIFTIAQTAWSRLTGHRIDDEISDVIEGTRFRLVPLIGPQLAGIKKERHDQAAFAVHALIIAHKLAHMIRSETPGHADRDEDEKDGDETLIRAAFSLLLDSDQEDDEEGLLAGPTGTSKVFEASGQRYKVFTQAYDRETDITELVREAQLREFRLRLDGLVQQQGLNILRLVRQLQHVLSRPENEGWNFGEEEGLLDGRRLSQLLASPGERRVFRQERRVPRADTAFTILLDCSGSMKAHVETTAVLADVLTRAMEMIGVRCEVLGFTTGAWTGGRARKDWQRAGQPGHPGRLNELCHMVIKPASVSWRHGRSRMGGLFKQEIFREGLDGEAVQWACSRLMSLDVRRRMLLVVSDGCPMDSATQQANDAYYLDNHLRQVVAQQERAGAIQIMALGVGLDLGVYYSHCLGVDSGQKLDSRMLDDIVNLMAGRHRR